MCSRPRNPHRKPKPRATEVSDWKTKASAGLTRNQIAALLGFPGKMGMSGAKVWDAWLGGDIAGIRNYCETDVLNTWLVYLRFQLMRGLLDTAGYEAELEQTRQLLKKEAKPHFIEFLNAWDKNSAV